MSEGNGSRRIYWVGGSKGGVGKSMMTLATVDHLLEQGANVLLVECERGGRLDPPRQHVRPRPRGLVVIKTAARNNLAIKQYGRTLDSSLEELGRWRRDCAKSQSTLNAATRVHARRLAERPLGPLRGDDALSGGGGVRGDVRQRGITVSLRP